MPLSSPLSIWRKIHLRSLRYGIQLRSWAKHFRAKPKTQTGQTEKLWKHFYGWPMVLFVVPLLIGGGMEVIGWSPPEFLFAKLCFAVSGLILLAKVVHWLVGTNSSHGERMIVTFLIFGAIGVGLVESLNWVRNRQQSAQSSIATTPTATAIPELSMSFEDSANVKWLITNHSSVVAQPVKYWFGLFDLDQPLLGGDLAQPLQIPAATVDYLNAGDFSTRHVLPRELSQRIKIGDRIFGTAEISCPGCKNQGYWLYIEHGRGGWFAKMQGQTSRGLELNVGAIKANPDTELEKLVPSAMRIPIK